MLIDESDRNFKRGIVVTATVVGVKDDKVFCKLDNGLDAIVVKSNLENNVERLQEIIQIGHVITGRIDKIKSEDEATFGVELNCKKADLVSHR